MKDMRGIVIVRGSSKGANESGGEESRGQSCPERFSVAARARAMCDDAAAPALVMVATCVPCATQETLASAPGACAAVSTPLLSAIRYARHAALLK